MPSSLVIFIFTHPSYLVTIVIRIGAGQPRNHSSVLYGDETGPGAHPVACVVDTDVVCNWIKRPWCEASSVEVKNAVHNKGFGGVI
jgi:hypothetical protein